MNITFPIPAHFYGPDIGKEIGSITRPMSTERGREGSVLPPKQDLNLPHMTANPSNGLFCPFRRTLQLEDRGIVIEENVVVPAHQSRIPSVESRWIPLHVGKLTVPI